jgi:hypothetical protein
MFRKNPTRFAWKSLQQSQFSPMFTLFQFPYLGYIDVAKDDGNSCPCTLSVRLKGIDHGYLLRYFEKYGAQDSAGPL